jgi:hypothetical protein
MQADARDGHGPGALSVSQHQHSEEKGKSNGETKRTQFSGDLSRQSHTTSSK